MNQNRSSPDLYDLIQTFNSTEKRHFRLFASRGYKDENQYLRLFDILEGQSAFDDVAGMKKLKVSSKSGYARIKNYLYNSLLESLEDYCKDYTLDDRFCHLINRIRILISKHLFSQATKLLKKAYKMADEKGLSTFHLIAERIELSLMARAEDFRGIENYMDGYDNRMKQHMMRAEYSVNLQMIGGKITWLLRYGESQPNNHQDWLVELCNHNLLSSIKYPSDLKYKLFYDNFNGLVYGLKGMVDEDNKHLKSYLEIYQSNPEYIQCWPTNYITALGNVAEGAADKQNYAVVLECTSEMRTFFDTYNIRNKSTIEHVAQTHSTCLEMEAWSTFTAVHKEEVLQRLLKCWRYKRHVTKLWYFNMALGIARYHFEKEAYNKANDWIIKVIHDPDDILEPQIQFGSRFLHLLNQYELGHNMVFEHAIPVFKEWMRKVKIKSTTVNLFLRSLKKLIYIPLKTTRNEEWNQLLSLLEIEMQKREEFMTIRRIDILGCVCSKTTVLSKTNQ
ncbi:MAG: hypothetical protein ACI959_001368 [Limisphaerales bacterium]|jgi:hypothetical protein